MVNTEERITELQRLMAEADIDLTAIGPTANMRYFLGSAPFADERLCLLLVSQQSAHLVVPALNADQVGSYTSLPMARWTDESGPAGALKDGLHIAGQVRRLAIDGTMRADYLLPLMTAAQPAEISNAAPLFATLRLRKSPDEIDALQRAAAQADRAMAAGMAACGIGVTEAEIAWAIETAFRLDGAERVEFTLVAAGAHGAFPHHEPGAYALQAGDAVVLDIGASLNGYKSDITRMVHIGAPSPGFLQAYEAVREANRVGRETVRPGVTAGEVDRATREAIERAGYGPFFIHRTGHGLGLEEHEPPWIMAGNPMTLEEGMVFSVEPGVYFPGQFGIRIEDIVVVTADGMRTLTGFDHELAIIDT